MTAKIILNPYAQRWNALKRQPEMEAALKLAGLDYDLVRTEYPGHGIELAAKAAMEGYSPIVAAGGDSTVNEVVNGLMDAAAEKKSTLLGVLPMGTANDLADNLGISKDLTEAARLIEGGEARMLDVCRVNQRYFVNNSGVGLEPFITTIQMEITRVQGIVRYLLATLIGIYRNPSWHMKITWDDGEYNGPVTLASVGNSARTGGMFYLTPNANAFDGKLTFLIGFAPSRLELLSILPKAMRAEKNNVTTDPRTFEKNTTSLKIVSTTPTPMHTDGEVLTTNISELSYSIIPGCLPILLNKRDV